MYALRYSNSFISDESVIVKRKYNVGHVTAGMQQWIFGVSDCGKRIGVIEFVTDRSSETLVLLIKKYCLEGYSICFSEFFIIRHAYME